MIAENEPEYVVPSSRMGNFFATLGGMSDTQTHSLLRQIDKTISNGMMRSTATTIPSYTREISSKSLAYRIRNRGV